MYFDAVLQNGQDPLFNGTTEQTVEYIQTILLGIIGLNCGCTFSVVEGESLRSLTVPEYLEKYANVRE